MRIRLTISQSRGIFQDDHFKEPELEGDNDLSVTGTLSRASSSLRVYCMGLILSFSTFHYRACSTMVRAAVLIPSSGSPPSGDRSGVQLGAPIIFTRKLRLSPSCHGVLRIPGFGFARKPLFWVSSCVVQICMTRLVGFPSGKHAEQYALCWLWLLEIWALLRFCLVTRRRINSMLTNSDWCIQARGTTHPCHSDALIS